MILVDILYYSSTKDPHPPPPPPKKKKKIYIYIYIIIRRRRRIIGFAIVWAPMNPPRGPRRQRAGKSHWRGRASARPRRSSGGGGPEGSAPLEESRKKQDPKFLRSFLMVPRHLSHTRDTNTRKRNCDDLDGKKLSIARPSPRPGKNPDFLEPGSAPAMGSSHVARQSRSKGGLF